MKLRTLTLALCLASPPAFSGSPENALVVQSVLAWESAQQAASPDDRLAALQAARSAIDTILRDHAQSDLAVSIALRQADLPFTREQLRDGIVTARVNAIIGTAARLLEEARGLASSDRKTVLRSYLMMREADAAITRAQALFPHMSNLGLFEESALIRERSDLIVEAATSVSKLCDNLTPQDCLFSEAERVAAEIEDTSVRVRVLSMIAVAQAEAGRMPEVSRLWSKAERVAAGIEDASERARALRLIAVTRAEAGQFSEAGRIAAEIEDASERVRALSLVAGAQAEARRMTAASRLWSHAEHVAAGIEDSFDRFFALWAIAVAQAEAGQFSEAERVAAGMEDTFDRVLTLVKIASRL